MNFVRKPADPKAKARLSEHKLGRKARGEKDKKENSLEKDGKLLGSLL